MKEYQTGIYQESTYQDTKQQAAMHHDTISHDTMYRDTMYRDTLQIEAEHMRNIFGGNDAYIKKIEKDLQVVITDRNGEVHIAGCQRQ